MSEAVDYVLWCRMAANASTSPDSINAFNGLATALSALREAVKETRKFLDIDTREPGAVWPVVPDMMMHRETLVKLYRAAEALIHSPPQGAQKT